MKSSSFNKSGPGAGMGGAAAAAFGMDRAHNDQEAVEDLPPTR